MRTLSPIMLVAGRAVTLTAVAASTDPADRDNPHCCQCLFFAECNDENPDLTLTAQMLQTGGRSCCDNVTTEPRVFKAA